ncbi:MAG: DNA gyrase inhibitor YacG [Planctomycetes bacterium]|nr:DNA gyrase inhibitor YacG [Planctomycetota bacterium]
MTEHPRCPACDRALPEPDSSMKSSGRGPEFPFCSKRCRLLDLDKWFTGSYVIPGPPVDTVDTDDRE